MSLFDDERVDCRYALTVVAHLAVCDQGQTGDSQNDAIDRVRRIAYGKTDEDDDDEEGVVEQPVRSRRVGGPPQLANLLGDFRQPPLRVRVLLHRLRIA